MNVRSYGSAIMDVIGSYTIYELVSFLIITLFTKSIDSIPGTEPVSCFECFYEGTLDRGLRECNDLFSLNRTYMKHIKKSCYSCSKFKSADGYTIIRGCEDKEQLTYSDACLNMKMVFEGHDNKPRKIIFRGDGEICYCRKPLCNSSPVAASPRSLAAAAGAAAAAAATATYLLLLLTAASRGNSYTR